jgi:hypothetical protein
LSGGYDPGSSGGEPEGLSKEELAELQLEELKRRMRDKP